MWSIIKNMELKTENETTESQLMNKTLKSNQNLEQMPNFIQGIFSNKKNLLIIIILIACIFGLIWLLFREVNQTQQGNIINKRGDSRIFENEHFKITYYKTGQYNITITASPFDQVKLEAEQKFLEITGLSKEDACRKDVIINTPQTINPYQAGKTFYLSFCANLPQPSTQINPNLNNLTIKNTQPGSGTVEMGNTKNGIFITFDAPIDLATTYISINPEIGFRLSTHPVDKNILIINPTDVWQVGIKYTIRIKSGILSIDGKAQLKQDIQIEYITKEPKFPEENNPNL